MIVYLLVIIELSAVLFQRFQKSLIQLYK